MFCPYPTTCEYDDYWKTGVHYCAAGRCQYIMTAKVMLEWEIEQLARIKRRTERQQQVLERLVEQYRKDFGGEAMSKNRGGGHAPPD